MMKNYTVKGKFLITQRATREYQFNLKTGDGELILMSGGFPDKADCIHCIEQVKKNAAEDHLLFEKKTAENLRNFFILKSERDADLCRSQQYSTAEYLDQGILLVKKIAPEAEISDLTV